MISRLLQLVLLGISGVLVALNTTVRTVEALSTPTTPRESRQFIQLTGADRLPASFVSEWPTWVLDESGKLTKIPDDSGFVPPTSIDELWQPMDLKLPQIRLALGLHVRDGIIRHVMPAVDVSFDGQHRNRGLCTVPRAYSWADFSSVTGTEQQLTLETRKEDDEEWEAFVQSVSIENALESVIRLVTEEPPEELGSGSNIIHVVISVADDQVIECPKAGSELRVQLGNDQEEALGELHVQVANTMAGSESEYLPKVYKPLFDNESFRRKAYVEWKKRLDKRDKKETE
jgi:hypothetical protein